jgi:hypothetical protein
MFLKGQALRSIGNVDIEQIEKLLSIINNDFNDKWVRRGFKIMEDAYVLKAMTPSNFDTLDEETAVKLKNLLTPLLLPYLNPDETIIYLDISRLPPKVKVLAHIDYLFFHALARRIHIPLTTNDKAVFGVLIDKKIETHHMNVGEIYEVNNMCLHMAGNFGDTDRWHIIADVIDNDTLAFLKKKDLVNEWVFHPSVNFILNEDIKTKMENMLRAH